MSSQRKQNMDQACKAFAAHFGPLCSENGILGYTNEEVAQMTPTPTPLELLDQVWRARHPQPAPFQVAAYHSLMAFLESPAVQALADPALGAAAAVIIAKLPELLEMEAKLGEGEWFLRTNRHRSEDGRLWGWLDYQHGSASCPTGLNATWKDGEASESNCLFVAFTRNLLHKAKEAFDAHTID